MKRRIIKRKHKYQKEDDLQNISFRRDYRDVAEDIANLKKGEALLLPYPPLRRKETPEENAFRFINAIRTRCQYIYGPGVFHVVQTKKKDGLLVYYR